MITKESIKDLYENLASDSLHLCAVPADRARITPERAKYVSIDKCKGFTEEITSEIRKYCESFLEHGYKPNSNVELFAISDMVCNALSRPFLGKFQIVLYSGLFTLMSHRLIVGQMITDVLERCRKRAIQDAEEHIKQLLTLSYLYGFWIYFKDRTYDLRNIAENLNIHNQTAFRHALGGAMLFIYLHELGHIELKHHDVYDRCFENGIMNSEAKEKIAWMEYEADQFALDSVKDHLRAVMVVNANLVFDMINEFELYALNSTMGHPLIYRRLERLISLLNPDRDKDLVTVIGTSVTKSLERHKKTPFSDAISGLVRIDIDERRRQFSSLLPSIEECERGFQTLCEVYRNMQN